MKKIAEILIVIIISYVTLWSTLYFWIMGLNTSHFIEYFQLSWISSGEIPSFIQWGAILGTILVTIAYLVWKARVSPRNR